MRSASPLRPPRRLRGCRCGGPWGTWLLRNSRTAPPASMEYYQWGPEETSWVAPALVGMRGGADFTNTWAPASAQVVGLRASPTRPWWACTQPFVVGSVTHMEWTFVASVTARFPFLLLLLPAPTFAPPARSPSHGSVLIGGDYRTRARSPRGRCRPEAVASHLPCSWAKMASEDSLGLFNENEPTMFLCFFCFFLSKVV